MSGCHTGQDRAVAGRPTVRDVARAAGVSVATVSAVINKNKYVSPELEQRVEEAVADLRYAPNLVARSLKMQETRTIGLVFPNVTSPIWPPLVRTVQRLTQQAGFDTLLVTTDEDVEREITSVNNLLAKRVDGILVTPAFANQYEHIREASGIVPVVVIERNVTGIANVVTNDEEVSFQAVSHLISHGRRKIGLLTIPIQASNTAGRVAGHCRATSEASCYDHSLVREVDVVGRNAFDLAVDLLANTGIDAVFTTSQSTAIGALLAAHKLGRRIPDDLAVFGYDDVPWMEVVDPPLSTIRQPTAEMAELATRLLLDCLEGNRSCDETHVLESSLVIRGSCGCSK